MQRTSEISSSRPFMETSIDPKRTLGISGHCSDNLCNIAKASIVHGIEHWLYELYVIRIDMIVCKSYWISYSSQSEISDDSCTDANDTVNTICDKPRLVDVGSWQPRNSVASSLCQSEERAVSSTQDESR
jgi:hypothetical protein